MKCNRNATKLVFSFDGLEGVEFDRDRVNEGIRLDAEMHGYEQKIRDNAAISRKQKDGTVINITEDMRRSAVLEMVTHLQSADTWNMRASKIAPQNPVFLDVATRRNCTYAEAEAWYSANMISEMQKLIDAEKA